MTIKQIKVKDRGYSFLETWESKNTWQRQVLLVMWVMWLCGKPACGLERILCVALVNPFPINHFETIRNSKLQATTEMWPLKDFKIYIA